MKKTMLLLFALVATLSASAQYYPDGRPIPPRHRHGNNRGYHRGSSFDQFSDTYFGFRLGMAVATVHSDAANLDGSDSRTGLDVGVVAGTRITNAAPLFFESGLSYTEKGGKGKYEGDKFTYRLQYLELPLLIKYKSPVARDIPIEPYAGGYLALGVGGKVKDYGKREAYSSFSNEKGSFRRFDGGLRIGCGASFDRLYVGMSYDVGLANVGHYDFEDTRTGSFNLHVGVTF